MKKFLVVMSYLALVSSLWAADFSLNPARDFGAIRRINPTDYDGKSVVREDGTGLSSDTAAAFRAALEVFSKAEAEPAGAVAAHAADTSTHGVATVAGLLDVANLQAAANASDALLLRLDGSRAMTGNLKFSGNYGILQSTSDGADNSGVYFGGGGATGFNRGATIYASGNETAITAGMINYYTGNVSTGDHVFYTGAGAERFRIGYDGKSKFLGDVILSGGRTLHAGTADDSDNSFLSVAGGGANSSLRGAVIDFYGNEHTVRPGHLVLSAGNDADGGFQSFWTQATERMRLTYGGNLLIGTTTDDGVNKLQVNGPVYVASYVSALGYIDRTEAPDTLDEAYAIVNSHEVTPDGKLDHSKLHPAAWGKKVELRPTGRMIEQVIETPVETESLAGEGVVTKEPETKLVEETEQVVVPDQSGRDLSMVISAQALVIKDLTKRVEALEAR